MNLAHLWNDLPTRLALIGSAFTPLLTVALGWCMGTHYTRVPGGRWTTWEKAFGKAPDSEEQGAA